MTTNQKGRNMTNRVDIITTVAKLRALAERGGENEAFAAMRKADRMMRSYNIQEAELAMAEADGTVVLDVIHDEQTGATKNGRNRSKAILTHHSLGKFCEVKLCYSWNYNRIYWVGTKADVEMAKYLAQLIHDALEREYANWKRSQTAVPRSAKPAFQSAMAYRISSRLDAMTRERRAQEKADIEEATKLLEPSEADKLRSDMANGNLKELTSTALVVASISEVKREKVESEFRSRHSQLSSGSSFGYASRGSAYDAGRAAGDRVGLGRPVGRNATALLS